MKLYKCPEGCRRLFEVRSHVLFHLKHYHNLTDEEINKREIKVVEG